MNMFTVNITPYIIAIYHIYIYWVNYKLTAKQEIIIIIIII